MLTNNGDASRRELRTIEQWMSDLGPVPLQKAFILRTVYDDVARAKDLNQVKNMLLDYIAYHHNYERVCNDLMHKSL